MRRRLKGRTTWVAVGVVAILAAGGAGAWALARPGASQATTAPILATATVGTVRQAVTTTGTLAPARQANLSFTVAGTVTSVPVAVGDRVTKGAILATVDSADLSTAVDLAQASVDAAQEQVTSAATGSAAQQASASAQLAAANGNLTQAKASLASATLASPITGTVAAVSIAAGDAVGSTGSGGSGGSGGSNSGGSGGSGTSGTSGSAQVVVISTGSWIVNASVGAADLAQVKKGLQVQISPDGSSERLFGTVSEVGIMATSGSTGSATFPVTIKVTGSPTGLYAGASVTAAIVVRQADNVLTIPTAAINSQNGSTYVTVSRNGTQTKTPVVIGTVYGASTQITSGLSEGDQVVVRQLRFAPAGTGGTGGTNQRQRGQFGGQFPGGGQVPGDQAPGGGAGQ